MPLLTSLLLLTLRQFPGFGEGQGDMLQPVPAALSVRAADCAECHPALAREWAQSRHHHSVDNALFLDGLSVEPHQRCIVCHAPNADQVRDTLLHLKALLASLGDAGLPADSAAREGITCATCHVRDGVVLTANPRAEGYGHPLKLEPLLGQPEFCAACHEFRAHTVEGTGRVRLLDEPMQSTFTEWKAWGGGITCQGCHMPGGSHAFHGGHDLERVRRAVTLSKEGRFAVVRTQHVGHRVPTGDVFRHLTLWADDVPLRHFGKRFGLARGDGGASRQVLLEDSSLAPDAEVRVPVPAGVKRLRLTYHFALDQHELRATLRRDELVQLVAELPVR